MTTKRPMTNVRLQNILSAKYRQCFPGNGVEFEELQLYQPGDDVTAIDWKATARSTQAFLRHYKQAFDNKVLFAIDTSSSMNSLDQEGNPKLQSVLGALSLLARTATLNVDNVGFFYQQGEAYKLRPFTHAQSSITHELANIKAAITQSYFRPSNWTNFFDYITDNIRERCICFVISDNLDFGLHDIPKVKLASLKHNFLFIELNSWLSEVDVYQTPVSLMDIETGEEYGTFLEDPKRIQQLHKESHTPVTGRVKVSLPVRYIELGNSDRLVFDIIDLLSGQRGMWDKYIKAG